MIDEAAPIKAGAVKALLDMGPTTKQADLFRATANRLVNTSSVTDRLKHGRREQLLKVWD
jgi:hypothetical protein